MKMKKLLKNAVVYAVAASMLFATPLTASAGLNEVYRVEDGSGHIIGDGDENEPIGTVTNTVTDTDTTVLTENSAKIIGISIDQEYVNAVKDEPVKLNATVVFDGSVSAEDRETANKFIRWEVVPDEVNKVGLNKVNIDVKAADRTVATVNPTEGTELGKEAVIRASIGNPVGKEGYNEDVDYDITFTDENGKKHVIEGFDTYYYAEAKVYVKEYSDTLSFKSVETKQYVKHTLNLGEALVRTPATANDEITWSTSDAKIATVSAAGVVTFKKATTDGQTVTITVVGEKGGKAKAEATFTVGAGKKAEKVEIAETAPHEIAVPAKNDTVDLGKGERSVTLKAVMSAKNKNNEMKTANDWKEAEDGEPITDVITWKSSKPAIVAIDGNTVGDTVKLIPKAVGKATITATASNGKKATFTLTVKAELKELKIKVGNSVYKDGDTIAEKPFSGQTLQLDVWKNPAENTGKVKWSIDKTADNKANPNATINAKGVVTFKTKVTESTPIVVRAKCDTKETTVTINAKQSSIKEFTVTDDVTHDTVAHVKVNDALTSAKQDKKNPVALSVPKGRALTVTINDTAATGGAETLSWKSSSTKVATVTVDEKGKPTITAVGKGSSTITVSGVFLGKNDSYKAIKATFKVNVTQPVTSLTMNKTSVVLKDTRKKLNVSLSVKTNKNAKADVTWTIAAAKAGVSVAAADVENKGKGKFVLINYNPGDEYIVTATDATGVKATATVKVVTTSTAATIWDPTKAKEEIKTFSYEAPKGKNGDHKTVKDATVLGLGESVTLQPMVNLGTKNDPDWVAPGANGTKAENTGKVAAGVTYSVNKKGIVTIVGNTVYRVNKGSVTVTVKTEDGKSYKLKIDDAEKEWKAPSTEPTDPTESGNSVDFY